MTLIPAALPSVPRISLREVRRVKEISIPSIELGLRRRVFSCSTRALISSISSGADWILAFSIFC